MRDYQYSLPANSSDHKPVGGNFIKVNTTGANVRVIAESAGGSVIADLAMSGGTWIKLTERFETVRVENQTALPVTVGLTIGVGEVDDSELTGSISLAGVVDSTSQGTTIANSAHTVGVAAAVLLGANSARRGVVILNNSVNDIYIGDNLVTTVSGLKLVAGQSMSIDKSAQAEIYAIASAAGSDVRTMQELD